MLQKDRSGMKNQRLAVQAAVLQKNPAEAELILRMSVIANAITAIGRTFDRPSSEMISAGDQPSNVIPSGKNNCCSRCF